MADSFGLEPWFAFAYLPLGNLCVVSALACMITMLVYLRQHPKSALSGALIVGIVGQSLFGHKEERFVFPLLPFAMAASAHALPGLAERLDAWLRDSRFVRWSLSPVLLLLVALNMVVLFALTLWPINWRGSVRTMQAVYNAQQSDPRTLRVIDAAPNNVWHMRFYANPTWARWTGETLHCNHSERTLVLVNPLHLTLPDIDAECTYARLMTEFDLARPWLTPAQLQATAHALPGKPLPVIDWQAVYELSPANP